MKLSLFRATWRNIIDQLRFGMMTHDQAMVYQAKAFRLYQEVTIAAGQSVSFYAKTPENKSMVLSAREIHSEKGAVSYRIFSGATINPGTGTPLTPFNRSGRITNPSQVEFRLSPTFQNNGVEVDYDPLYGSTSIGNRQDHQDLEGDEVRELFDQEFRVQVTNNFTESQRVHLRWKWYEVDLSEIKTGNTVDQ